MTSETTTPAQAIPHTISYIFDEDNFHIDEDYYECTCGQQWIASEALAAYQHEESPDVPAHEGLTVHVDPDGRRRVVSSLRRGVVTKGA